MYVTSLFTQSLHFTTGGNAKLAMARHGYPALSPREWTL